VKYKRVTQKAIRNAKRILADYVLSEEKVCLQNMSKGLLHECFCRSKLC
jgi:hypothetical protein